MSKTLEEKLQLALDNKEAIKSALEEKGVTVSDKMSEWSDSISEISVIEPIKLKYNITSGFNKLLNNASYITFGIREIRYGLEGESLVAMNTMATTITMSSAGTYNFEIDTMAIGEYVFKDCPKIISVTIPSYIKSIGTGAFKNCTGLKEIIFNGTQEQWEKIKKGSDWNTSIPSDTRINCIDATLSVS